jgi:ectoine hydroxylase-related dioxygenase (phytanoyl-CoA dioxygenase family)
MTALASDELARRVEVDGLAIVSSCLDEQILQSLSVILDGARHAQRNLLRLSPVRDLAVMASVKQLVGSVLGSDCFAVRGILFNKTRESNWKVVWHQDRTIAVRERRDIAGFGPWTMKASVPHVQPPHRIMAKLLAIRLHLDESDENNGPLRVIPGSHREGLLSAQHIAALKERPSTTCTVPRGGAILMRPLLLHASSACLKPVQRRVIHLEFAADELPDGLEWYEKV